MKDLTLNITRTSLAIGVIAVFVWLNWWVLPDLAFLSLEVKGSPPPQNGYTLNWYENGKYVGSRVIKSISLGWSGVAAAWPYMLIGMLSGLAGGYVVGEFARRKLAVEQITWEVEDRWREKIKSADEKDCQAIKMLASALSWRVEIENEVKKLNQEREQLRLMREELQQEQRSNEERLKKAEMKEKDAVNARDKVKRLEAKVESLEKTIDELKKSP
jgi:cell fate (sporulation/competence/biofilm development) regulator YlbF (YheA/YmcA/DUF963 family)